MKEKKPPRQFKSVGQRVTMDGGKTFGTIIEVDPAQISFPYTVLWDGSDYETRCGEQFTNSRRKTGN